MKFFKLGRTLVPEGVICLNKQDLSVEIDELEEYVFDCAVNDLVFEVDGEGSLLMGISGALDRYYLSYFAMKEFAKYIRWNFSLINKFPGREMVLHSLNQNPYKKDNTERLRIVTWENRDEDARVVVSITQTLEPRVSPIEMFEALDDAGAFDDNAQSKFESATITGECFTSQFSVKSETPVQVEGGSIQFGYSFLLPFNSMPFQIKPTFRLLFSETEERFEIDVEPRKTLRKVKRSEGDFLGEVVDLLNAYKGNDLGVMFELLAKAMKILSETTETSFGVLKKIKTAAVSAYNYAGNKVDPGEIANAIVPEYVEFMRGNKDRLRDMEPFQQNELRVNIFPPLTLSRLYAFPANMDNPYFFLRSTQKAWSVIEKLLEAHGDIEVDFNAES